MKIHNDFTLYFRVTSSGKRVVYFYAYDENGKRTRGRSTGQTNKTAARVLVNRLLKDGALLPKKDDVPTFGEYSVNWWDWENCEYLKKRRKRANLTQSYSDHMKRNLDKVILPYFKNMRMDAITPAVIEAFLDSLIKQKYKNTTINGYYGTFKTMMIEAVERGIIAVDPTAKVERLINDRAEIKIITPLEFKKLFVGDWRKVWENSHITCTVNKVAALSGMRVSEILGLKGSCLFDDHIYVCMQHDNYGYRLTKTKDKHNIPLPASLIADLKLLKEKSGDGYLFSTDGGGSPICRKTVLMYLRKALVNIGISSAEIKERNLHIHAWRHFFNTEMLKGGMTTEQAQAITTHKSERMTERYTHFDPLEFVKAKEIQEALLQPVQDKTQTAEMPPNIFSFPVQNTQTEERKQA
ncbi:integrase [Treponema sp. R8-4-B8]